ncbi:hypothetical protein [Flavobacterium notoginsengisoli]|uniref:hypothetical protein n=1 Tax=Flavobacterium notoginsengisoli TaxID=1478199 RepID=UPI00362E92A5
MKTIKSIFLTILYTIILIFILGILNWIMYKMIEKVVGPLFFWFYDLHWFWKLLLLFFGGSIVITIFLNIVNYLAAIISTVINIVFPYNKIMVVISSIIVIINIILLEIDFWKLLTWDFWMICLWLILTFFIVQVNIVFIFRNPNEV